MNPLSGPYRGYTMVPHGRGWFVSPLLASWRQPTTDSDSIVFGQDGMSAPQPLGFTFPFTDGESSSVWVNKDGYACFGSTPYFALGLPPAIRFLSGAPCIAPFWSAFDQCNCGTVRIDHDPVGNSWASITWSNVRESGTNYLSTFQTVIHADGMIDVAFFSCHANSHAALSGWSAGFGAMPPGPTDLSELDTIVRITLPDRNSMLLESSDAPRLGTTIQMETSHMPEIVKFVFTAIGMTKYDPGIDLTGLGVTGCNQLASYETGMMSLVRARAAYLNLIIPLNATLVGTHAYLQSVGFDRTANPAGILLSNGFELRVDF